MTVARAGHAPWPAAAASAPTSAVSDCGGATYLRCGGCGATAVFVQRERCYGRLVHGFLDRHGACGNAVEITATRPSAAVATRPLSRQAEDLAQAVFASGALPLTSAR
jgi:hypothetical protein